MNILLIQASYGTACTLHYMKLLKLNAPEMDHAKLFTSLPYM